MDLVEISPQHNTNPFLGAKLVPNDFRLYIPVFSADITSFRTFLSLIFDADDLSWTRKSTASHKLYSLGIYNVISDVPSLFDLTSFK